MQWAVFVKEQNFFGLIELNYFFFLVKGFLLVTKFILNFNLPSEMHAAPSHYRTSSFEVLALQSQLGSPWDGPCMAGQC